MLVTNYSGLTSSSGDDVLILTGAEGSTVVKSLEIIAPENNDAVVTIYRKDRAGVEYGAIKLDLEASNYVMLWEGFVAIPYGHELHLSADISGVEAIANVVDLEMES